METIRLCTNAVLATPATIARSWRVWECWRRASRRSARRKRAAAARIAVRRIGVSLRNARVWTRQRRQGRLTLRIEQSEMRVEVEMEPLDEGLRFRWADQREEDYEPSLGWAYLDHPALRAPRESSEIDPGRFGRTALGEIHLPRGPNRWKGRMSGSLSDRPGSARSGTTHGFWRGERGGEAGRSTIIYWRTSPAPSIREICLAWKHEFFW